MRKIEKKTNPPAFKAGRIIFTISKKAIIGKFVSNFDIENVLATIAGSFHHRASGA